MKKSLLFLGTGGSVGVPVIGCPCTVCSSKDPCNHRLRPSILLRLCHQRFLIDVGPDFRQQALRYGISRLDGILLTHAHYDHTAGVDDLRPIYYQRQAPLPMLMSIETAREVRSRYPYLFPSSQETKQSFSPFTIYLLPDQAGKLNFEGVPICYVTYHQGEMAVNGFRIGDLAYLSDIRLFSPSIFAHLKGVKDLIISALRYTSSPLHFSVDEAIDFAKELKAERVWLTHLSHELEHQQVNAYLPVNMQLAYDGLEIEFE